MTESERSNIIDQVYFTAEKMLQSIQQLHSDDNQLITPPIQQSTDHHPDSVAMETAATAGEPTNNANKVYLHRRGYYGNLYIRMLTMNNIGR